jgi:carbonic anhydrase
VVPVHAQQAPTATTTTTLPHWTYEGPEGPNNWGTLSPAYAACSDGTAQTPINIHDPTPRDLVNPTFALAPGAATAVNTGHTVQVSPAGVNAMTIDGVEYQLRQLHFHAPGEHTVDGRRSRVEVHFVHQAPDGTLAVVAVMLRPGRLTNAAWDPYVKALSTSVDEGPRPVTSIDVGAMLPQNLMTFRYSGSLTTPPCSEGVAWLVMRSRVELSARQIGAFTRAYRGNYRPIQRLNGRPVEVDSTATP